MEIVIFQNNLFTEYGKKILTTTIMVNKWEIVVFNVIERKTTFFLQTGKNKNYLP